jgi:hypothetical protein
MELLNKKLGEPWGNAYKGKCEKKQSWKVKVFYCFGKSEENEKVVAKIKEYKEGKDYILSHNQTSEDVPGLLDKYKIKNTQLKKKLGEIAWSYCGNNKEGHEEHRKSIEEHRKAIEEQRKVVEEAKKMAEKGRKISSAIWKKKSEEPGKDYVILETSQEPKKWNWPAFWTGTLVATLIFGLILIIAKLFKRKKHE